MEERNKKMKKTLVMAVVTTLLLVGTLSGCIDIDTEEKVTVTTNIDTVNRTATVCLSNSEIHPVRNVMIEMNANIKYYTWDMDNNISHSIYYPFGKVNPGSEQDLILEFFMLPSQYQTNITLHFTQRDKPIELGVRLYIEDVLIYKG